MYLARMIAIPAALLWTTHAFQPPKRRLPRIGQRRLVAPEEASVAVQAYADKAASAIAAAVAGADASLLASTGFTLAQAGIVVAAAALGAAAMRLFNREERRVGAGDGGRDGGRGLVRVGLHGDGGLLRGDEAPLADPR